MYVRSHLWSDEAVYKGMFCETTFENNNAINVKILINIHVYHFIQVDHKSGWDGFWFGIDSVCRFCIRQGNMFQTCLKYFDMALSEHINWWPPMIHGMLAWIGYVSGICRPDWWRLKTDSRPKTNYNAVIMGAMASQITSLSIVYSIVYSGADQRKHQSSASLAFVMGIHRSPVNSPHEGPVTRKCFHLMTSSCNTQLCRGGRHIPESRTMRVQHIPKPNRMQTGNRFWRHTYILKPTKMPSSPVATIQGVIFDPTPFCIIWVRQLALDQWRPIRFIGTYGWQSAVWQCGPLDQGFFAMVLWMRSQNRHFYLVLGRDRSQSQSRVHFSCRAALHN